MMVTRTMHPPAGSNPIIVFLTAPGWGLTLFPTLFGAMALVAAGVVLSPSATSTLSVVLDR
jgi:CBS-domain-containing membrane protein